MRQVDAIDPTPNAPGLEPGGWLHFDVSFGCAGNMLAAALLDLGLPERSLRACLREAGLSAIEPRLQSDHRNGIGGLHLDFVDEQGHPIDGMPGADLQRNKSTSTRGRRQPTPHLARTPKSPPKSADIETLLAAPVPSEAQPASMPHPHAPPMHGRNDGPEPPTHEAAGEQHIDPVLVWLRADQVPASELLAFLAASRLSPISKALSQKALRRALQCLAQVKRVELTELALDGRSAVDMLADVVCFASLIEILSPSRVTTSIVGISNAAVRIGNARVPGPSPWVLAALEGMSARELDIDFETTTPTGAALLWSVAHRCGVRDDVRVGATGVGLGTHNPRAHANICRAMYGPPVQVETLSDQPRVQHMQWLVALLGADADCFQLERELLRCGATSLSWQTRQNGRGEATTEWSCAVPPEHVDAAVNALYNAGSAGEVVAVPAVCRSPAQHVVMVRIGAGKRHAEVRVAERRLADNRCLADPLDEDVRSAARSLQIAPAQARAMAWLEWSQQNRHDGAVIRDGDEVKK